jgi:hypothetical protein
VPGTDYHDVKLVGHSHLSLEPIVFFDYPASLDTDLARHGAAGSFCFLPDR